jgi:hypothetical protein
VIPFPTGPLPCQRAGPGCAVVTAGPGVTDAVTGVANACRAQTPMLLIGGQGPLCQNLMGSLQAMDNVDNREIFLNMIRRADVLTEIFGLASWRAWGSHTRKTAICS